MAGIAGFTTLMSLSLLVVSFLAVESGEELTSILLGFGGGPGVLALSVRAKAVASAFPPGIPLPSTQGATGGWSGLVTSGVVDRLVEKFPEVSRATI